MGDKRRIYLFSISGTSGPPPWRRAEGLKAALMLTRWRRQGAASRHSSTMVRKAVGGWVGGWVVEKTEEESMCV